MSYTSLYVPRESGTYSETFLLFGLEKLVSMVLSQLKLKHQTNIINYGSYYELTLPTLISNDMLEEVKYEQLVPYIVEKEGQQSPIDRSINLPDNYARLKDRKELLKQNNENRELLEQYRPDEEFEIAAGIKNLKAITTYNAVLEELAEKRAGFSEIVKAIFEWFSTPYQLGNELPHALAKFSKKELTRLSIFNPLAGKGAHHANPGNVVPLNKSSYWFLEWLKFIGIYQVGFVRSVGDDSKVYVLEPRSVTSTWIHGIKNKFATNLPNAVLTPVKADIIMILLYLQTFIECRKDELEDDDSDCVNLIEGLHTVYFFDMGQAKVVSNISFLNLPSWVQFKTSSDYDLFMQLIQNHLKVIKALTEDGTTTRMLQSYRDFLVGEDLQAFFDFYAPYAELLLGQLGESIERRRYKYVVPFIDTYLDEVIKRMESKLTKIIKSEGFKKIASAIRKSTISLQYKPKADRYYEVRYGMAQDLKRKSTKPDLLVEYLSEFCASYNQENARVYERTGVQYRKNITQHDLDEVFDLIANYGTIVGKLLMVYGYAREDKDEQGGDVRE